MSYKLEYRLWWALKALHGIAPVCLYGQFHPHQHILVSSQPGLLEMAEGVFIFFTCFCCASCLPALILCSSFLVIKSQLLRPGSSACSSWNFPKSFFCAGIFIAPWYYYSFCTCNPVQLQDIGVIILLPIINLGQEEEWCPCFVFSQSLVRCSILARWNII